MAAAAEGRQHVINASFDRCNATQQPRHRMCERERERNRELMGIATVGWFMNLLRARFIATRSPGARPSGRVSADCVAKPRHREDTFGHVFCEDVSHCPSHTPTRRI